MNDILIETCNYIYKNPGFSNKKYIKEMSQRSIWKGINMEYEIDYMIYLGILIEVTKYNKMYSVEYDILEVNISGFINWYNKDFNNKTIIDILNYVQKHFKKSEKTLQKDFAEMTENSEIGVNYLDKFLELRDYGVLRLKSEYYNDYKYYGLRIDFAQLKNFVL